MLCKLQALGIIVLGSFLMSCGSTRVSGNQQPTNKTEVPTSMSSKRQLADETEAIISLKKAQSELDKLDLATWNSPDGIKRECNTWLTRARATRDQILSQSKELSLSKVLHLYNQMLIDLIKARDMSQTYLSVHQDAAVRKAATECNDRAENLLTESKLDREIYELLQNAKTDNLTASEKAFLKDLIEDFELAGVGLDKDKRKKLSELKNDISRLKREFLKNIRNDVSYIDVDDFTGLPSDFVKRKQALSPGSGSIRISTDYGDFYTFLKHSKNPSLRKKLYLLWQNIAFPENVEVLIKLLVARSNYANLLGYKNWAAYNARKNMARSTEAISDFISKVADIAKPRMESDLKELLRVKKRDEPGATKVWPWDSFYYNNILQKEKYGIDSSEVRSFFDFEKVIKGVFSLFEDIFNIRIILLQNKNCWDSTVESYAVYEGEELLGLFFLDLSPRSNKRNVTFVKSMVLGVKDVQIPIAIMVGGFGLEKSHKDIHLIDHQYVVTFIHEMGHLLHYIFGGKQHWVLQSVDSCERDFIEVPALLYEQWTWDASVLPRFALHYENGKLIPAELVKRMSESREQGLGLGVMFQLYYAAMSYFSHIDVFDKNSLQKKMDQISEKYNPYAFQESVTPYTSFLHLASYSSAYYTYLWSSVLVRDVYSKFQEHGLLDRTVNQSFRKKVLQPGGSRDPSEMLRAFLGRNTNFDAFRKWLSLPRTRTR